MVVSMMPVEPQPAPRMAPRDGAVAIFLVGSMASLAGAVGVFCFGTVVTDGTYGSRMAWLVGVVLPLLLLSAGFAGLVWRRSPRRRRAPDADASWPSWMEGAARTLLVVSATLVAIPVVLVLTLLLVYAALIAGHYLLH